MIAPDTTPALYEEPGIRLSATELTIGRFAYRTPEIEAITLEEVQPKRSWAFILFTLGGLGLAYFVFENIYGVLLVAIAMFPSLMWLLRPRTSYAVTVLAAGEHTQPVRSLHASEAGRIVDALNAALAGQPATPTAEPTPEQVVPSATQSVGDDEFVRTIPRQCPKCDNGLTMDNLDWHDLNTAFCRRCHGQVPVTWRKA